MSRTPSALQASENFEPSSEWVHEEGFRTLLVHLPGFKREQIKVQISNTGHINISGERPLEGRRRSKFIKQYPLPEHCKVAETRAKFENEALQVRFSIAQDEVTRPLVPTPTMHKSPSSPMERTTTQQGEKGQERNGKSQKAVPEEEELRRKQEQPKAKEEIGRREQPKATGIQEKKQEKLQDKEKSGKGRSNSDVKQDQQMSPALKTEGRSKSDVKQDQQMSPALKTEGRSKSDVKQDQQMSPARKPEGRSNSDTKQGQQISPTLKTEDTSSLEKKQDLPESSSFPGSNGKGTEMTAKYSITSLFMEFPPNKKTLLVNVAVAGLVLLAIGLYLRYK